MYYLKKMPNFALEMSKNEHQIENVEELNPVWATLSKDDKEALQQHSTMILVDRNEDIFVEGDTPQYVYMVVDGKVRMSKNGVGQTQILSLLKPYDIFGFRAPISNECYTINATAFEPSLLYAVEVPFFQHLTETNVQFCQYFMKRLSVYVSMMASQTVNLSQKHIRGRLAETLVNLLDQYGLEADGATLSIYLSREDLANMSSMTTSNAIRTLSQFAQDHLIAVDGRKIKILCEDELRKISRLG